MYQYSVAGDRTKQVVGGRSRLHLIDLGQLERADCKRGRVNIIIIDYYYYYILLLLLLLPGRAHGVRPS